MNKATEKIHNLGLVKIHPVNKTNAMLHLTNTLANPILEQGAQQMVKSITGFMKWKQPTNLVLEPEIKTKEAQSMQNVKGQSKS